MRRDNRMDRLVIDLENMAESAIADRKIKEDDLRRILRFLTKIVQVANQALEDVMVLLIEIKFLDDRDFKSRELTRIRKEIDLLQTRSRYRDVEEICSRLHHLSDQYRSEIEPIIAHKLHVNNEWENVFFLINEHEGAIIELVKDAVRELQWMLSAPDRSDMNTIKSFAADKVENIRDSLIRLQILTNRILGLSGQAGFLELTADRSKLERNLSLFLNKGVFAMGDSYLAEQAGAIGLNAQAQNMIFVQVGRDLEKTLDFGALADQLSLLRKSMKDASSEPAHDVAIGEIAKAEEAARRNEGSKVVQYLREAGKWALDFATQTGATIAAEAIKKSMGMP